MLYINGELLNVANREESYPLAAYVKEFHDKISELKNNFGNNIKLQSSRALRLDPHGKLRAIATKSLPLEISYFNKKEMSNEEWTYSTKLLSFKDGKFVTSFERTRKISNGELWLDLSKEPDLAFYAIIKSGKVGEDMTSGRKFFIHNKRKEAKKQARNRSRDAKLSNTIYNDLDKTKLSVLAKGYGISNVDILDVEQIKNMLYDIVNNNEDLIITNKNLKARGIDAFMRDTDLDLRAQIRALAQDAKDKGLLIFNHIERRWEIDYHDNRTNYSLMDVSRENAHQPNEVLIDFLHSDDKSLEKLKKSMGVAGLMSVGVELDTILQEKNPQKLKKMAREFCSFPVENKATAKGLQYKIITELFSEETAKEYFPDQKS